MHAAVAAVDVAAVVVVAAVAAAVALIVVAAVVVAKPRFVAVVADTLEPPDQWWLSEQH